MAEVATDRRRFLARNRATADARQNDCIGALDVIERVSPMGRWTKPLYKDFPLLSRPEF